MSGPDPRPAALAAALRLPQAERAVLGTVLGADVALLSTLEAELALRRSRPGPDPARHPRRHLDQPARHRGGAGPSYGAAIGDPWRFPNAAAAYRASGRSTRRRLRRQKVRRRGNQHISREGSVLLREAIIELGKGRPATTTTLPPTAVASSTKTRKRLWSPP